MLGKFTIIEDKEEVTESDNLQEIELNSNCYVNNKFIGTTVAKKATIKILNENEYELENKNIKVELGIEHYNPAQTYIGKNIEIKNAKSIKPQIKINGFSTQATRSGKNLAILGVTSGTIGEVPFIVDKGTININGTTISGDANYYFNSFRVSNSGVATFWIEITGYTDKLSNQAGILLQESSDNSTWSTTKEISCKSTATKQYQVTLDNSKYYRIRFYTKENTFTNATIKIQLEYGTNKTEFEEAGVSPSPDYKSPIENVEGKNKFDYESAINVENLTYDNTYAFFEIKNIKPNTAYTISNLKLTDLTNLGYSVYAGLTIGNTYSTGPGKAFHCCIYNNVYKNGIGVVTGYSDTKANGGKLYFCIATTNTNEDLAYERFIKICSMVFDKAQIEEGSVATPYVPYNSLEFKVEGKNRFDKEASYIFKTNNVDKIVLDTGVRIQSTATYTTNATNFYVVKLGNITDYLGKTIRIKTTALLSSDTLKAMFYLGTCTDDGTSRKLMKTGTLAKGVSGEIFVSTTISSEQGDMYDNLMIALYSTGGTPISSGDYIDYNQLIVTADDEDMTYEPYKSQVETFPLGNQKLMEGSYLSSNGIHNKNKQVVITEDMLITTIITNYKNLDYVEINKPTDYAGYNKSSGISLMSCAKEFTSWNFDSNDNINKYTGKRGYKRFSIGIPKGMTFEEIKNKLIGQVIEYELSEEETVPYTAEQQEAWEKIKNLKLFEGTNNIKSEAELTITLGKEYIIEGKYKVPKPDTEEVSAHTTFTGYDNMKNFDIPYVDNNTYPKRLDDCLESLCQQVGLVLGSKTFPNNSYMIKGNPFTNGETCKTVLSHLVQLTGGFAEIDMENENVYVRNFDISGDAVETIDGNNYDEFKPNNVFGPVNSIRIQMNSGVDGEETIKEAEGVTDENRCQITIADNYYLTSKEERQAVINGIFNALNGLTYLPIELSYYGYPWLKLGNKIKVKDKNDKEYITYVMEHTLKYNGAYSGIIKATALTKTQVAYTETLSIKQWKRNTELSVSKIEGKITQLTEETTENSQKLTQQEQDINGLKTKVSNIQDLTQTTIGNKTIILSNCAKGNLLSLKIKGNNTVFKYLYPSETLYPTDDLYPAGDSRILVNDIQYELGVLDTLRQNGKIYDEYILEGGQATVFRRINADGTIKASETIEKLGTFNIPLNEGTNTIKIKNYSAEIGAKYVVKSDYTEAFATKVEMNSSIEQTAEGINQVVRKKVDENEIISKINQSAEEVGIDADRININGTVSANGNFEVDKKRKHEM